MKNVNAGVLLLCAVLLTGCGKSNDSEVNAEAIVEENAETAIEEDVTTNAEANVEANEISPIIDRDGADPFVMRYGERYLYTKTTGNNISLAITDSIQTLGAAKLQSIYEPGAELQDLWAPEIWQLDGTWYIYFAAVVPGEEMHHMYVLSNESDDPMQGEWECSALSGMDDKFAIDGTIMEVNGKRYFIWSGWEGYENIRQDIYLAEMVSPVEVMDEKILLSAPEYDWEMIGEPLVNEGPEAIVRGSTVNLVYSASGSWTDDYCLGLLTMDIDSDPKNPDSWVKEETPIMSKDLDVYGPGHNCFTTSIDNKEDLIIYHAARWMSAGWNRSIRFGYIDFDENGMLQKIPVKSGENFEKIPSGEPVVSVYPADQFDLSGDLELREDSGITYAVGMVSAEDIAKVSINANEERDVYVTVFVKVDDLLGGVISGIEASLNGEAMSQELYAAENYQPLYFPFHLEKGENILELRTDIGGTELKISRVEVR